MLAKRQKYLTIGLVAGFIFLVVMAVWLTTITDRLGKSSVTEGGPPGPIGLNELRKDGTYNHLPVQQAQWLPQPNSWGTIILIPQYHYNVSEDDNSAANILAAATQQQIYDIIDWLSNKAQIDLMMLEGELKGEIPPEKIELISDCVEGRGLLARIFEATINAIGNLSSRQWLAGSTANKLSQIDQTIILQGAPFALAGTGQQLDLVGVEDAETLEAGREIIRKHVYLSDRLRQLAPRHFKVSEALPGNVFTLKKLLGQKDINEDLARLTELSEKPGRREISEMCSQMKNLSMSLRDALKKGPTISTPTRADNPYSNETNQDILLTNLNEVESQIDNVVVNLRNEKVAANAAEIMRAKEKNIAVLPFGVRHEQGLIEELHRQNLDVILVRPQSLAQ